jgi:superkiller protein 3
MASRVTRSLGAIDYAENAAARARLLDPWDTAALRNIAEALLRKGFLTAARRHAEEALRIEPDSAETRDLLARIDAQQSTPPGERAIVVKPPPPSLFGYLLSTRRGRDLAERLIPVADRFLDDPILQLEAGECLLRIGWVDQGRERIAGATARLGGIPEARSAADPAVLVDAAYSLYQRGDYSDAVVALRMAIELDPTNAAAHNTLGLALLRQKNAADAEGAFRAASRLAPQDPTGWHNLAAAFTVQHDYAGAARALEEGLTHVPDSRETKRLLAELRAAAPDAAVRSGATALRLAEEVLSGQAAPSADDLAVLAAARAETGNFPLAVEAITRAADAARQEGNPDLAVSFEKRRTLYLRGSCWRMP